MIRFLRRTVCDVPFPIFVNKRPFRGGGIHSKGGGTGHLNKQGVY